jgi:hypothetical protein
LYCRYQNFGNNIVDAPERIKRLCEASSFEIWSLLDMLEFYAGFFCAAAVNLQHLADDIAHQIALRGGDALVTEDEVTRMRHVTNMMTQEAERMGFQRTIERLGRFINLQADSLTLQTLSFQLQELQTAIRRDMFERTFLHMPRDREEFYHKPELFGEAVNKKFPQAAEDIQAAGDCFATGNNTACVFHLMRVLEHGLRALARMVKVKFSSGIELESWGRIIKMIGKEINEIEKQPHSKKRAADLEFYNGAATQFRFFKDAWRNHVMHTRATYDEHQAMSVITHVREFMQQLATRARR